MWLALDIVLFENLSQVAEYVLGIVISNIPNNLVLTESDQFEATFGLITLSQTWLNVDPHHFTGFLYRNGF